MFDVRWTIVAEYKKTVCISDELHGDKNHNFAFLEKNKSPGKSQNITPSAMRPGMTSAFQAPVPNKHIPSSHMVITFITSLSVTFGSV